MRGRILGSILAGVAAIAFVPILLAQNAPRPGAARPTPDLSGTGRIYLLIEELSCKLLSISL